MSGNVREAEERALFVDLLMRDVMDAVGMARKHAAVIRKELGGVRQHTIKQEEDRDTLSFQEQVKLLNRLDDNIQSDLETFYHRPDKLREEISDGWDAFELAELRSVLTVERFREDHLPRHNEKMTYWAERIEKCAQVVDERMEEVGTPEQALRGMFFNLAAGEAN